MKILNTLDNLDNISDGETYKKVSSTEKNTWNGKQDKLATQTAYSAKGSATKVPQITTNTLGQVTGITEVNIDQPTKTSQLTNDSNFVTTTDLENLMPIITIQKQILLTTDWQDTGIAYTDLTDGTYIIQASLPTSGSTANLWAEKWAGIMSWYAGSTNSDNSEEIVLHNSGHADNANEIFLRTKRYGRTTEKNLNLQIAALQADTSGTPKTITFKFRKIF